MPPVAEPLKQRLQKHWFRPQEGHLSAYERLALGLIETIYRLALTLRNKVFYPERKRQSVAGVHTISVGNLIVGGAGKTPTVMAIAQGVSSAGWDVAILSRGYKSKREGREPLILEPTDLEAVSAEEVGDEAWLLCWRCGCRVAVGKDRLASLKALKARNPKLQIAILDDGLSQRQLQADRTLLVMDSRGFGNRHCLPLGPLREPATQLDRFDAWVDNGFSKVGGSEALPHDRIALLQHSEQWVHVDQWQRPERWLTLQEGVARFRDARVLAVAGIAVPERFFETLRGLGISFEALPLEDHDPTLVARVLTHCESRQYDAILMTEKDAVKFFHKPHGLREKMWALRQQAQLEPQAIERLTHGL